MNVRGFVASDTTSHTAINKFLVYFIFTNTAKSYMAYAFHSRNTTSDSVKPNNNNNNNN
jgi:hypothetical protein